MKQAFQAQLEKNEAAKKARSKCQEYLQKVLNFKKSTDAKLLRIKQRKVLPHAFQNRSFVTSPALGPTSKPEDDGRFAEFFDRNNSFANRSNGNSNGQFHGFHLQTKSTKSSNEIPNYLDMTAFRTPHFPKNFKL